MKLSPWNPLLLVTTLGLASHIQAASLLYTFDDLTVGTLATSSTPGGAGNQGSWYVDPQTPNDRIYITQMPDTNKVANAAVPSGSGRAFLLNDSTFFTGTETAAIMQFDVQFTGTSGAGVQMALGGNGTASAVDNNGKFGPLLSFVGRGATSVDINLRGKASGGGWSSGAPQSLTLAANDWISVRIVMDLTANSNTGLASVYYKNLTLGDSEWNVLSGLQNVDLDLNYMTSGFSPDKWNQVFLRINGSTTSTFNVDNLYVNPVPEPSVAALLALSVLLGGTRGRRARSSSLQ